MEQFSLEKYLENPLRKVVTRMGRKVRIICTDREDSIYPIIALIKDDKRESEILVNYTKDGIPSEYNEAYYTLFFTPEKHEGWVCILRGFVSGYYTVGIFDSEEKAKERGGSIATVKVEWED